MWCWPCSVGLGWLLILGGGTSASTKKGSVCLTRLETQQSTLNCILHFLQNPKFGQTIFSYQASFYCDVKGGYRCYVPKWVLTNTIQISLMIAYFQKQALVLDKKEDTQYWNSIQLSSWIRLIITEL